LVLSRWHGKNAHQSRDDLLEFQQCGQIIQWFVVQSSEPNDQRKARTWTITGLDVTNSLACYPADTVGNLPLAQSVQVAQVP
jgi:hypothetical protein